MGLTYLTPLVNRLLHRSPMQTEKTQLEGTQIMPETSLPSFQNFLLTRGLGFLGLHRRPIFFLTYDIKILVIIHFLHHFSHIRMMGET